MSYLLVLTAAIRPNGMANLKIADPAARLRQYIDALQYWLALDDAEIRSILLIENSGADLSPLRQLAATGNIHRKQVEIIGLNLNDYPRELGKGYGEFLALDRGLAESELARSHEFHVKLTGRLMLRNLGPIIRRLPAHYDLATDLWPGMVDSRLVLWSWKFYQQHIAGLYHQMHDRTGRIAERVLYDLLLDLPQGRFIVCLPLEPSWIGLSATHGVDYGDWRKRLQFPFRQALRTMKRAFNIPNLQTIRGQRVQIALPAQK